MEIPITRKGGDTTTSRRMMAAMFDNREDARRAVHALEDHGIDQECISVLAVADDGSGRVVDMDAADKTDAPGKDGGISTTTAGDAGKGAAEGAAVGAGLGLAAALASLFIPGFGFITAGGALATALGGAAIATAGGAAVGGVTGFLMDLGVPDDRAEEYTNALKKGGVLISVHDTDELEPNEAETIFRKYNGRMTGNYVSPTAAADPDVLDATNRRLTHDATDETLSARGGLVRDDVVDRDDDIEEVDVVTGSEGSASSRLNNRDVSNMP